MNPKKSNYPVPKSGDFNSYLFALLLVFPLMFGSFKLLEGLLKNNFNPPDQNRKTTQISWEINELDPLSPKKNKFVEANPNAPENPPDQTKNFSFRDQQAANPDINQKTISSELPKLDGKEKNQKITSAKKEVSNESQSLQIKTQQIEKKGIPEATPTTSVSKNVREMKNSSTDKKGLKLEEKNETRTLSMILGQQSDQSQFSHSQFKSQKIPITTKRPKLSPELLFGPVMKSTSTAPRVGTVAIECRMHVYGVYIQQMLQAIEEQWNQLASGSIRYLQRHNLPDKVTFKFVLRSDGKIEGLSRVDSQGNSLPTDLCRQAIASRVPFGKWTSAMIEDFGEFDEITLSFNYR